MIRRLTRSLLVVPLGLTLSSGVGVAVAVADTNAPAGAVEYRVDSTADEQDASPGDGLCASAADGCTLRAAVMEANAHPNQLSRITLPAGRFELSRWPLAPVTQGFNLVQQDPSAAANGDLDLFWPTTIVGAGAGRTIVDAKGIDRIFNVRIFGVPLSLPASPLYPFDVIGPRVEISDLTLTGGRAMGRDMLAAQVGGAILSVGDLVLRRVHVTGNEAFVGGGIFSNGELLVEESTISDNVGRSGVGGIRYDGGGVVRNSTFTNNRVSPSCCVTNSLELLAYSGGPIGVGSAIDSRAFAPLLIENSTIVGNHSVLGAALSNVYFYVPEQVPAPIGTTLTVRNTIIAGKHDDVGPGELSGDQRVDGLRGRQRRGPQRVSLQRAGRCTERGSEAGIVRTSRGTDADLRAAAGQSRVGPRTRLPREGPARLRPQDPVRLRCCRGHGTGAAKVASRRDRARQPTFHAAPIIQPHRSGSDGVSPWPRWGRRQQAAGKEPRRSDGRSDARPR